MLKLERFTTDLISEDEPPLVNCTSACKLVVGSSSESSISASSSAGSLGWRLTVSPSEMGFSAIKLLQLRGF